MGGGGFAGDSKVDGGYTGTAIVSTAIMASTLLIGLLQRRLTSTFWHHVQRATAEAEHELAIMVKCNAYW